MPSELIFLAVPLVLAVAVPFVWKAWKKSRLVNKLHDSANQVVSNVVDEYDPLAHAYTDDEYDHTHDDKYTYSHQDVEELTERLKPIHRFFFERAPEAAGFEIRQRLSPQQRELCNTEWQRLFGRSTREGLLPVYERDPEFARKLTEDRMRMLADTYGEVLERYCKMLAHGPPHLRRDIADVGKMIDRLVVEIDELGIADWREN